MATGVTGGRFPWRDRVLAEAGYHKALGSQGLAIIRAALKDPTYRQKYRQFLRRLKQARQDGSLTQVQVARKLSRPQSFVSKVESGERRVDAVELA